MPKAKVLFPFVRRENRGYEQLIRYSATISRFLDKLEKQVDCNSFIKVKEGYIPAHSIFLCKSNVINGAFSSNMAENREKVFDLSIWDTILVMDLLEIMYTDTLENICSSNVDLAFELFNIIHFLDIPELTQNLLVEISTFARLTILIANNCLDVAIPPSKLGLSVFTINGIYATKQATNALNKALWIVTETAQELHSLEDTIISNYCKGLFDRRLFNIHTTYESIAYISSHSLATWKKIIDKSASQCLNFNPRLLWNCLVLWIHEDPKEKILQLVPLISGMCTKDMITYETCPWTNVVQISQNLANFKTFVEQNKREYDNWNVLTPFSISDQVFVAPEGSSDHKDDPTVYETMAAILMKQKASFVCNHHK